MKREIHANLNATLGSFPAHAGGRRGDRTVSPLGPCRRKKRREPWAVEQSLPVGRWLGTMGFSRMFFKSFQPAKTAVEQLSEPSMERKYPTKHGRFSFASLEHSKNKPNGHTTVGA